MQVDVIELHLAVYISLNNTPFLSLSLTLSLSLIVRQQHHLGTSAMADDEESTVASYRTAQFEAINSTFEYDGEERLVMREDISDRRLKKEEKGIKRKKRASDDEPEEYPTNANSNFALIFNQMATEGTSAAGLEDVHLQTSTNEVLRIAKLVSAALFAYDQHDLEHEFLKDWNYDKKDMYLL